MSPRYKKLLSEEEEKQLIDKYRTFGKESLGKIYVYHSSLDNRYRGDIVICEITDDNNPFPDSHHKITRYQMSYDMRGDSYKFETSSDVLDYERLGYRIMCGNRYREITRKEFDVLKMCYDKRDDYTILDFVFPPIFGITYNRDNCEYGKESTMPCEYCKYKDKCKNNNIDT